MLTLVHTFNFSIIINNNLIDYCLNIETNIKNYINDNLLYKNNQGLILIKLLSFSRSEPKLLPNNIIETNKYKIYIEAKFECLKFIQDMIINNLIINKNININNINIFLKKINNDLTITCIDKNKNNYSCNDFAIIQKVHFINNNLNILIDKFDPTLTRSILFNSSFDINNNFINIIQYNIHSSFKFHIDNKQLNFKDLLAYFNTLKKNTNFIASFNSNKIVLLHEKNNLIPLPLIDQYFNNLLLNFYNNYLYYKI